MIKFYRLSLVWIGLMSQSLEAGSYQGIIGAAPNTSANNFYNLVNGDTTLTQAQFVQYYVANYGTVSKESSVATLLDQYIADAQAKDYAQAQIDLVRLAAAVFRYTNIPGVAREVQLAVNPWTGGALYVSDESASLDQNMVNSFVAQFAALYQAMKANPSAPNNPINSGGSTGGNNNNNPSGPGNTTNPGNNNNNTNNPSGPSNTTGTGSALTIQRTAISQIKTYETNTNNALTQAEQTLAAQLAGFEKTAQLDPHIAEQLTKTLLIQQLNEMVLAGEQGFTTLADNGSANITAVVSDAFNNLTAYLNNDDRVTTYMNPVDAQAATSNQNILAVLNDQNSAINGLQNQIADTINGIQAPPAAPSEQGISDIVLTEIIAATGGGLTVLAWLGKRALCKLSILSCPPLREMFSPAFQQKYGAVVDFFENLKLSTVRDAVNQIVSNFRLGIRAVRVGMSQALNITEDTFNQMVNSDKALAAFVEQTETLVETIQASNPSLAAQQIWDNLGARLESGQYTSIMTDAQLADLADRVAFDLSLPPAMGSAPSIGRIVFPNAEQLAAIESASDMQGTLISNIKEADITLDQFSAQLDILKNGLHELEVELAGAAEDSELYDVLTDEVAAQKLQISAAEEIESNWAQLIPKEI